MTNEMRMTLIAAGAALFGTIIGGIVTVVATITQIHANQQQALNTFLISQREAIYTTFLTDASSFYDDEYTYRRTEEGRNNLGEDIVMLVNKLNLDSNRVSLVGPPVIAGWSDVIYANASDIATSENLIPKTPNTAPESTANQLGDFLNTLTQVRQDMSDVISEGGG